MRHLLPLTLLLTACASNSTPEIEPSQTEQSPTLSDSLTHAAKMAKLTCQKALPDATSFVNRCDNSFALALRSTSNLSAYVGEIQKASGADQPAVAVADALGVLLAQMSEPGMPDDVFMQEGLRNRLSAQIADEGNFADALKLASIFSDRIAEVVVKDLNTLYADFGLISLEVLDKVSQSSASEAAYLDGLRNKKTFLREAVLKDMQEGLPPGWDPAPELVAIEELLRSAELEINMRATKLLNLEAEFDLIGIEIKKVAQAFSNW